MKLSIVIPVYNEEENLAELYRRLSTVLTALPYSSEVIFVDDASSDSTSSILKKFAATDKRIKAITFSRNFGHQMALIAGFDIAEGDVIVSMDGDLQDQPEVIPLLIEKFNQGFDIVYAKRRTRRDTVFKKSAAFIFYRILNGLSSVSIPSDVGDFRLMSRQVKQELLKFKEQSPFLRGLVSWMGFRQATIEFDRDRRFAGSPKFSLKKLIDLAIDGVMSFTAKPLWAICLTGMVFLLAGLIGGVTLILYSLMYEYSFVTPEFILSTLFFLAGVLLVALGTIGIYIARISSESQNRPRYIIRETINL